MLQIFSVTKILVYVHFHILYTLPKSPFHRHVIVPYLDSLNLRLAPFKLRLAHTLDRLVLVTPIGGPCAPSWATKGKSFSQAGLYLGETNYGQ